MIIPSLGIVVAVWIAMVTARRIDLRAHISHLYTLFARAESLMRETWLIVDANDLNKNVTICRFTAIADEIGSTLKRLNKKIDLEKDTAPYLARFLDCATLDFEDLETIVPETRRDRYFQYHIIAEELRNIVEDAFDRKRYKIIWWK